MTLGWRSCISVALVKYHVVMQKLLKMFKAHGSTFSRTQKQFTAVGNGKFKVVQILMLVLSLVELCTL